MKPADLHPILAIVTLGLLHAGLMASVFVGLHRAGTVIAALGLIAAGAWAITRFIDWDTSH